MRVAFRYDTRVAGHFNSGPGFEAKRIGNGVIGPPASKDNRWELIEFLKNLGQAGTPQ